MPRYWHQPAGYEPTPFQRIILDIIRENWPTIASLYDLARRIDVSGPTVVQWMNKPNVVPHDAGILGRIAARFNVSYTELYAAVGLQVELPPPPAPYTPIQEPARGGDQWDDAYARIRALPMPPEIAEQMVAEMQRVRFQAEQKTRQRRYVEAEHTVQPFDGATQIVPALPAVQHQAQQRQRALQARSPQPTEDTQDAATGGRSAEIRERRGQATSGGRARTRRV